MQRTGVWEGVLVGSSNESLHTHPSVFSRPIPVVTLCTCFSEPQQTGGHDQGPGLGADGRQARTGLHGGAREDPPRHQRQHQLARRALVLLRGARARGHDHGPGVLPEAVLRGAAGRVSG